ncbi:hypothetical protein HMI56_005676 [Coelomomyces lativittatus]|nr:hypothetical protein HMI56_005676 [Coelomomyces lativittatus]
MRKSNADDSKIPLCSPFQCLQIMQPPVPNTPEFCLWMYEVKEKALPLEANPCSDVLLNLLRIWNVYKIHCGVKLPSHLEILNEIFVSRKDKREGYFTSHSEAVMYLVNESTFPDLFNLLNSIFVSKKYEKNKSLCGRQVVELNSEAQTMQDLGLYSYQSLVEKFKTAVKNYFLRCQYTLPSHHRSGFKFKHIG